MRLAEMGDYLSAITLWQDCVRRSPDCAPIYFLLGEAYRHTGQMQQAVNCIEYKLVVRTPSKIRGPADRRLRVQGRKAGDGEGILEP